MTLQENQPTQRALDRRDTRQDSSARRTRSSASGGDAGSDVERARTAGSGESDAARGGAGAAGSESSGSESSGSETSGSDSGSPLMSLIEPRPERPSWGFLTNHGHVMVALSRDPELRQRDLSYVVGITPGAVQRILDDLEQGGFLRREKIGRRNRYEIVPDRQLRHPLENRHTIGELLDMLRDDPVTP